MIDLEDEFDPTTTAWIRENKQEHPQLQTIDEELRDHETITDWTPTNDDFKSRRSTIE